jgi:hypothetical protein
MVSLLFVVLGTALSSATASPTSPSVQVTPASAPQELVLTDGSRLVGIVERVSDRIIVIRTGPGERSEIAPSRVVAVIMSTTPTPPASLPRDPWYDDSSDSRLLLGPTARSLKRGEAYVDDFSVFFPSVQVGLSDRVSIGAGTPLAVPQTDFRLGHAVWITPKVQVFTTQKTQAALGLVHAVGLGHHAGLAYAVATHGTSNTAVTLGLGLAYPQFERRRPIALVGAEKRVSSRVKLITENYVAGQYGDAFLSAGVRFIHRRQTLDLSWVKSPGSSVYPVPLIRFSFQVSGL